LAYVDVGESIGADRQQVSRSAFSQQMRWLKTEGFSAITPTQLTVNFMEFIGQLAAPVGVDHFRHDISTSL
jgi:hypothetical protein